MNTALELHDSRVGFIEFSDGLATIDFSHAYIHSSKGKPGKERGTGWSREARLYLRNASVSAPLPPLPNTISEGYLEVGGIRLEPIPLPFKRKVGARLHLVFGDGSALQLAGERPWIELSDPPILLHAFP